ncbi:MAG: hypothetical protein HOV76_03885 [Hamadaea sp.]|nr:hypothetical protein [Hamadaea sp.]
MGYDLHITRAFLSYDSERYPILGTEVDDLVRDEPGLTIPPDAPRRPDFCYLAWESPDPDDDGHLWFEAGRITTKNPRPEVIRRMTVLAARLDAWVIGDDGEVYGWDGNRVVDRQRDAHAFILNARYITRGTWFGGMNGQAPIRLDEWEQLAAAQPDFVTMTRIEATLPSGVRWISCPPVVCWTGHPSGRPRPFFFDDDVIEVRQADEPTVRRMAELAMSLGAKVVDDNDQAA